MSIICETAAEYSRDKKFTGYNRATVKTIGEVCIISKRNLSNCSARGLNLRPGKEVSFGIKTSARTIVKYNCCLQNS